MTTAIEKAIEKAIEGGLVLPIDLQKLPQGARFVSMRAIFSDPAFWQSLSKNTNWEKVWDRLWHRFIDHLIAGKGAESFFADLLKA